MPELLSAEAIGAMLGVSGQAVRKAHAAGRLSSINGKFDPAVARIQWEANRRRRPARPGAAQPQTAEGEGAHTASPSGEGSDYWSAKTKREAAEAAMAELKLAELSKSLVQRAAIDRVLFGAARVMRDQMLALAPRLAATVAPLSDPKTIELKIADEVRVALRAFAQQLRAGGMVDVSDGLDR